MLTLSQRGASYRTKCLTIEAAARFATCLNANARFTEVEIVESQRAKGEARWFVQFLPASAERQAEMLDRQQATRAERAATQGFTFLLDKDGGRPFYWCHSHTSGEVYEVAADASRCGCMDDEWRCRPNGLACKHRLAARAAIREGRAGG